MHRAAAAPSSSGPRPRRVRRGPRAVRCLPADRGRHRRRGRPAVPVAQSRSGRSTTPMAILKPRRPTHGRIGRRLARSQTRRSRGVVYVERSPADLTADARGPVRRRACAPWQVGRGVVLLLDVDQRRLRRPCHPPPRHRLDGRRSSPDRRCARSSPTRVAADARGCDPDTAVIVGVKQPRPATLASARGSAAGSAARRRCHRAARWRPPRSHRDVTCGRSDPGRAAVPRSGARPLRLRPGGRLPRRDDREGPGADPGDPRPDRRRDRRVLAGRRATASAPRTAEAHAQALMDQWGVGRRGFDDGLVILYDLDPSLVHGQVQLFAGPGYRATFLSNEERQAIFDERHAAAARRRATSTARSCRDERRSTPTPRPSTPRRSPGRARSTPSSGLVGAPVLLAPADRVGGVELAALRARPALPRRPVDLHARPAAGPDGRRRGARLRRPIVAAHAHDRDAGSREPRRARVPARGPPLRRATSWASRSAQPNEADAQIGLNRRKPISPAEIYAPSSSELARRAGRRRASSVELQGPAQVRDQSVAQVRRAPRAYTRQQGLVPRGARRRRARW